MVKPYTAVGLIPTVRGIRTRADIKRNLDDFRALALPENVRRQILSETALGIWPA